jgi:O-antigen/teichoic acid export membrane protein
VISSDVAPDRIATEANSGDRLARGASVALGGKIATAGLSYVALILAAKLLGADGFGVYTIALTLAGFLTTVGVVGNDNALNRLVPARMKVSPDTVPNAVSAALSATIVVSVVAVTAVFLNRTRLAAELGLGDSTVVLVAVVATVPLSAITAVARASLQASRQIGAAILGGFVAQAFANCLGLLVLFAIGWSGPRVVVGAFVLSHLAAALLTLGFLARRTDIGWKWLRASPFDRELSALSRRFLLVQVLINAKTSIVVLVIGHALTATDAGLYSAALRTANLVSFVLVGINVAFTPMISALWVDRDVQSIEKLYRQSVRWALAVSLPACLVLIVAAPAVLGVFATEYRTGAPVLIALALAQLVNAGTGSVGYLLMMTGREDAVVWNSVAALIVAGVGAAWAAPRFGVTGAAVVGGLVATLLNVGLLVQVGRSLRVSPYDANTLRVLFAGAVALVAGVGARFVLQPDDAPLLWITVVALTLVAYTAAFVVVAITPDDRRLLHKLTSRARQRVVAGSKA